MLQLFHDALVAGIVRNRQHEIRMGFQNEPPLFLGKNPAVVRQGMDDHGRVFTGLHHFIQIADGPVFHGQAQRTVLPDRFISFQEKPPDQIRGRQILMTGDRHQRQGEFPGHVFQKTGLSAARGSFQHHGKLEFVSFLENVDLIVNWNIKGFAADVVIFYGNAILLSWGFHRRCIILH